MKVESLKSMSDSGLEDKFEHSTQIIGGDTNALVQWGMFCREELARRDSARVQAEMCGFTQTMHWLTWVIAGLTAMNLVFDREHIP